MLMKGSRSPIDAIASRARLRFQNHRLDAVYPVCWPAYRIRLTVTVLEESELAATSHYILKFLNIGVGEPTELGRMLGLPDNYIAGAAAELLRSGLVSQGPNRRLAITEEGIQTLKNKGQAMSPKTRQIEVPFDPLTRKVLDIDVRDLLNRDAVLKGGLFLVQSSGSKPQLSDMSIETIKDYNSHNSPDDQIEQEIINVSEIRSQNARLQYRQDIHIAKLDNPDTGESTFAAFCGHQYLEDETMILQRLAESGVNLVPGEFQPGRARHQSWYDAQAISSQEMSLLDRIEELDIAANEAEQAAVEEESPQAKTSNNQEHGELTERIAELEAELRRHTNGAIRLIKTEDHHPLLLQAIDQSEVELSLVSAWIDPYAFDDEVIRKIISALKRGVTVRIGWGLGVERRDSESQRNLKKGEETLEKLKRSIPQGTMGRLIEKRISTHEKFIICDDRFCAWGSFNWLSYRGNTDRGYRRETSAYSSRPEDIELWKQNASTLFQ